MNNNLKPFLIFLLIAISIASNAQKLPNKQETSVWAPANIKIDGKAIEWDDTFQAYNHATEVFYTISNDDKNLYLVIHTAVEDAINKIVGKGLSLTIQKIGKKDDKSNISITAPLYDKRNAPVFSLHSRFEVEDTSAKNLDIIMRNYNLRLNKAKFIGIVGIKGIDSLISIYNEDKITVAQLFNNKKVYTLEFAIALSYLQPCINNSMFAYNIRLNGARSLDEIIIDVPEGSTPEYTAMVERQNARQTTNLLKISAATDFSGEYTLAKKP